MPELQNPGALLDTRPESEKQKDQQFAEVVAATNPVQWIEKPRNTWRKFPIQSQNGSGSCVAQTLKKMIGVYIWLKTQVYVALSATHIYQRRAQKPAPGMSGIDAFEIGRKGVTLEQFAPSENLTDAQMDSFPILPFMEEIGKVFKLGEPIILPTKDIDAVASVIQTTGKAVMTWFYFTYPEWQNVPKVGDPNLDLYALATLRHSIASLDWTLLGQSNLPEYPEFWGKKALISDESWGLGVAIDGQRIITEDFFAARNFFAAHFMNFAFEDQTLPEPTPTPSPTPTPKPHYTFMKDIEFIPWNSDTNQPADPAKNAAQKTDTIALQDILKYEGLLPTNISSTGYFGSLTKKSVEQYQLKYKIVSAAAAAGYGRVGPKTRTHLNTLYGN